MQALALRAQLAEVALLRHVLALWEITIDRCAVAGCDHIYSANDEDCYSDSAFGRCNDCRKIFCGQHLSALQACAVCGRYICSTHPDCSCDLD